jgi:hypothetical protein
MVASWNSARVLENEIDQLSARVFGVNNSNIQAVSNFVSSLRRVEPLVDLVNLDVSEEEAIADSEDSE